MFLNPEKRHEIIELAIDDLLDFLDFSEDPLSVAIRKEACDELSRLDPTATGFSDKLPRSECVHLVFEWLEKRPFEVANPTAANNKIRIFLQSLKQWLECFASADENLP